VRQAVPRERAVTLSILEPAMLCECLERLGQLEARVAALEASERRDPLRVLNAARATESARLRQAVRSIIAADTSVAALNDLC